ncbi:vWA domain-containing protein [Haliangium sp.]|uniref:vWA domain-containing protein n=1 Tax=Haliangium sp. TaxID=2663208 RepID=UPI003D0ADDAD
MKVKQWFVFGIMALAAGACGGGGDGTPPPGAPDAGVDPCLLDNPPAECGKACTSDSSCGIGFHCGDTGFCTADCSQTGNECGNGRYCDDRGYCRDGSGPGDKVDAGECASIDVRTELITPVVQLMIDRSGTMQFAFGNNGDSRAEAVRDALLDQNNGVVAQLESQVKFGATVFSALEGSPPCPVLESVFPALNNYDRLNTDIRNEITNLIKDTPTGESIEALLDVLPAAGPNEKRIMVLATDGEPDTCADPDADEQAPGSARRLAAQELSLTAVRRAHDEEGIDVYILSVGDDVGEAHLREMANVGLGLDPQTGQAPFFVANNPAELVSQLTEIISGSRECRFTLNGEVTDVNAGTVTLNGTVLELGTDWRLVDASTIELIGDTCQTYLSSPTAELSAEFECEGFIIVE